MNSSKGLDFQAYGDQRVSLELSHRSFALSYFALFYDVVEDFVAQRQPFREEHLRRARESQSRGEMLLGGALADPFDRALLVFRAADRSVAEVFAKSDPYVVNGLVKKWEVRVWNVVVGTAYDTGAAK